TCSLRKGAHANSDKHLVRYPELVARVDTALLATQPLSVQQVRACELRTHRRTAKPLDGLEIELFSHRPVEQRGRSTLDADRPIGAGRFGPSPQACDCGRGEIRFPGSDCRLDELGVEQRSRDWPRNPVCF